MQDSRKAKSRLPFKWLIALAMTGGLFAASQALSQPPRVISNADVCAKTLIQLVQNQKVQKTDFDELIRGIRQLKMTLDPLAIPSFAPIIANESSSADTQAQVAARLRGIEVFGLKVGLGSKELSPSDKTIGMAIEGEEAIKEFFEILHTGSLSHSVDEIIHIEKKMSAFTASAVATAGAASLTHSPAAFLLPVLFNAWNLPRPTVKNDFKPFSQHVLDSIASHQTDHWAHYGRQTRMPNKEIQARLAGVPHPQYDDFSQAGFHESLLLRLWFGKELHPAQEILTDYTFLYENGQPKLYVFSRITDRKLKGPGTPKKNDFWEKAKQSWANPWPPPARQPATIPVNK